MIDFDAAISQPAHMTKQEARERGLCDRCAAWYATRKGPARCQARNGSDMCPQPTYRIRQGEEGEPSL